MSGSTRVAEGEYKVLSQAGIGSFDLAVYDFTESWTLWRLKNGTLEVTGTRNYRSPADEPHSDNFEAYLSDNFRVLKLREFRTLRWRPNSGPLSCDFLTSKGRMHRECKAQKPRLESGGANANGRCRSDVADFCILVEQYHPRGEP